MFKKVQPLYPLTRYLPFQFSKGAVIRQFSKPCLRCNEILHSQHMHGLIRSIDQYAAIAAQATCFNCELQFNIACIINHQKEVRRVLLPALLFRWYLQILPYSQRMPAPTLQTPRLDLPISSLPTPAAAETVTSTPPPLQFERSSEAVGQFNGNPIPAYIIVREEAIPFVRIASSHSQINLGEYLIDGQLIYGKSTL